MTDPNRAAFEAWVKSVHLDAVTKVKDAWGDDVYLPHVNSMWFGWQASRKAALEDAHAICEGCETAFNKIASSDLVTPQGRTVHASMAMGAKNCANEIKGLLK